jgi:hypothetical protein
MAQTGADWRRLAQTGADAACCVRHCSQKVNTMANIADDRGPLTLHWFGELWGAEINDMAPHDPTPDGQACSACKHVIEQGDQ